MVSDSTGHQNPDTVWTFFGGSFIRLVRFLCADRGLGIILQDYQSVLRSTGNELSWRCEKSQRLLSALTSHLIVRTSHVQGTLAQTT